MSERSSYAITLSSSSSLTSFGSSNIVGIGGKDVERCAAALKLKGWALRPVVTRRTVFYICLYKLNCNMMSARPALSLCLQAWLCLGHQGDVERCAAALKGVLFHSIDMRTIRETWILGSNTITPRALQIWLWKVQRISTYRFTQSTNWSRGSLNSCMRCKDKKSITQCRHGPSRYARFDNTTKSNFEVLGLISDSWLGKFDDNSRTNIT